MHQRVPHMEAMFHAVVVFSGNNSVALVAQALREGGDHHASELELGAARAVLTQLGTREPAPTRGFQA